MFGRTERASHLDVNVLCMTDDAREHDSMNTVTVADLTERVRLGRPTIILGTVPSMPKTLDVVPMACDLPWTLGPLDRARHRVEHLIDGHSYALGTRRDVLSDERQRRIGDDFVAACNRFAARAPGRQRSCSIGSTPRTRGRTRRWHVSSRLARDRSSPKRYPRLTASATTLGQWSFDSVFDYGRRFLLAGIETSLAPAQTADRKKGMKRRDGSRSTPKKRRHPVARGAWTR